MNFDEAFDRLPFEVRHGLETSLSTTGIPKTDPVVGIALVQAYLTEVIEKRRRRGIYWTASALLAVVGIGSAFGGYKIGKLDAGASIIQIKGEHAIQASWVADGKTYIIIK